MSVTRVRWRERQRVYAADLRAEQAYHLQSQGRHHLAPHDWGVVRGLWLIPAQPRYSLRWRLTPGVAIDGYGRELLVAAPVDFELPDDAEKGVTYRVFLYYCEAPSACAPCAPCRDDPAPRVAQYVQVVVSASVDPITADAADLAVARAAGSVAGAAPWPVLVGTIRLGGPQPVNAAVRYHRQRASLLRSPSGDVLLRQGLLGPDDRYHVELTTEASSSAPQRRIAIDRDGTVHVHKPLWITGAVGTAVLPVSAAAMLIVRTAMPAGAGRDVRISGTLENVEHPMLTLRWRDDAGTHAVLDAALRTKRGAFLDDTFRFAAGPAVQLRLVDAARRDRRVQVVQRPKGERKPALVTQAFSAELSPSGGALLLVRRDLPPDGPTVAPCDPPGDVEAGAGAAVAAPQTGGIVYVRPAAQDVPAPTVRAIHTVAEPRPDGAPVTNVHLVGGERDDGDHGARVSFGTRDSGAADGIGWGAALTIDGGGRTSIPQKDSTLQVDHTLQLPPITASPTDPLSQDLLALAYNAGLRRVGRVEAAAIITFVTAPASVQRGTSLDYALNVAPGGATIKRVLELIVGTLQPGDTVDNSDVALRTIPKLAGTTANANFAVSVAAFQHRADHVTIALEVLLARNGKDYAFSVASAPIAVTD